MRCASIDATVAPPRLRRPSVYQGLTAQRALLAASFRRDEPTAGETGESFRFIVVQVVAVLGGLPFGTPRSRRSQWSWQA